MKAWSRWPVLAAFGAVTVVGFAPFDFFPLPLITLAWLFHSWRAATPRRAAVLGLAWGLGFFLAGVSWVYVSLHDVGGMALPLAGVATLLFCGVLALFPALAGYCFARARRGVPWRDALLAAGVWTLSEWLRGWVFTGFPWLALGYAQTPPSPLSGYAPVLGIYGLGLMAALCAAVPVFDARRVRAAFCVLLVLGSGQLLRGMAWTQPVGAPLKISLLQGNIPQSLKWDPARLPLSMDTYAQLAQRHAADLTVLPETAIPLFFEEIPREFLADLARRGAALVGAAVRLREAGRPPGYTNGAVAVTAGPAGTLDVQAYAKRHLVPFGEFVPPGFAWFFSLVRIPLSDFTAGPPVQPALSIAGQKVAVSICYEDLFGEEVLAALPEATLLINLSNTAWFGASLAQSQHLQIARMRAIETGRPMLRATNTGMTAAIGPDGAVAAVLAPFTTGALLVETQGYAGITPYMRYGNTAAVLLALLACLPALRLRAAASPAARPDR